MLSVNYIKEKVILEVAQRQFSVIFLQIIPTKLMGAPAYSK